MGPNKRIGKKLGCRSQVGADPQLFFPAQVVINARGPLSSYFNTAPSSDDFFFLTPCGGLLASPEKVFSYVIHILISSTQHVYHYDPGNSTVISFSSLITS
ncbi:hypothetical protein AFLA_008225 [Aspergillus flavus NRRL3357]|nr:hypothetical protein AFLA_008225 [Aspergillus flavus NRRL3357]